MAAKIIVCRCEDVTLKDIEHALAQGFVDIEELKRYTGLGTGPCQGKECMAPACMLLAEARAHLGEEQLALQRPEAPLGDHPFTARPPLQPLPLGLLARGRRPRP